MHSSLNNFNKSFQTPGFQVFPYTKVQSLKNFLKEFSLRHFSLQFSYLCYIKIRTLRSESNASGPMGVLKYFSDRDACLRTNF